jgi:muconolactone delta-isomerase
MQYMASITFDLTHRADIEQGMQAEQARVRELMHQGVMDALYVPAEGAPSQSVWVVLNGVLREAVQHALESLPLYQYVHIDRTPLRPLQVRS